MKCILSAIAIATVLVSCGNKSEKDEPVTTTVPKPIVLPQANTSPVTGTLPSSATLTTPGTVPVSNPNNQPVTISSTSPQTTVSTAAGMNPAHGQPGHRCDIAVGAPLNSSPAATTTPTLPNNRTTTVSAPVITTTGNNPPQMTFTPQPQTKTVTAPGMNPAHGEPGHVCGIPVGSPLNGAKTADAKPTTLTPAIVAAADSSKKQ